MVCEDCDTLISIQAWSRIFRRVCLNRSGCFIISCVDIGERNHIIEWDSWAIVDVRVWGLIVVLNDRCVKDIMVTNIIIIKVKSFIGIVSWGTREYGKNNQCIHAPDIMAIKVRAIIGSMEFLSSSLILIREGWLFGFNKI